MQQQKIPGPTLSTVCYCKRRYFGAVHIFENFAEMKNPRKYVQSEYLTAIFQNSRIIIQAKLYFFVQIRENVYTQNYLRLHYEGETTVTHA